MFYCGKIHCNETYDNVNNSSHFELCFCTCVTEETEGTGTTRRTRRGIIHMGRRHEFIKYSRWRSDTAYYKRAAYDANR